MALFFIAYFVCHFLYIYLTSIFISWILCASHRSMCRTQWIQPAFRTLVGLGTLALCVLRLESKEEKTLEHWSRESCSLTLPTGAPWRTVSIKWYMKQYPNTRKWSSVNEENVSCGNVDIGTIQAVWGLYFEALACWCQTEKYFCNVPHFGRNVGICQHISQKGVCTVLNSSRVK